MKYFKVFLLKVAAVLLLVMTSGFCLASATPSPTLSGEQSSSSSSITSTSGTGCYANNLWFEQMELRIDPSDNPCSDYYEYACGNWQIPYELRSLGAHDTLTAIKADNRRQLIAYLESQERQTEQQQRIALPTHRLALVRFYSSCLDSVLFADERMSYNSINNSTTNAYIKRLQQISDWPILNPYFMANSSYHWEHVSAHLRRFGVDTLWRLIVQSNWQSAEQQILYLVPPSFDLIKKQASATTADELLLFMYQRYVKNLMLALGIRTLKAKQIAEDVANFEQELLELASSTADTVILNEPQTLASLARELPDIRLWQYFNALLHDAVPSTSDLERVLVVANKRYLLKLAEHLRTTKIETLAKYMLVKFFEHFEVLMHTNDKLKDAEEHCLHQLNAFLPNELAALFLEMQPHGGTKIWYTKTKYELKNLFSDLKMQFEVLLNATTIFDREEGTKELGLEKLRNMRLLLPPVEAAANLQSLGFNVDASYDENLLNLSQVQTRTELTQLLLNSTETNAYHAATNYGPLQVNAYYRLKKNAIELPIGLLRPPFYESCLAPAKVYGSFAYMLAHEMVHGFDYDGINYDQSGNVANAWGAKSIIQFGTKSSCYFGERYEEAALQINENMADSEGLRLALEAFKQHRTFNNETLKLFFLSFAQTWCSSDSYNERSSAAESNALSLHASNNERVNNALGNFFEFADVYKCRDGSYMNPSDKCRIW